MFYLVIHAFLAVYYINVILVPPDTTSVLPRIRDIVYFVIVILSYSRVDFARRLLIVVSFPGLGAALNLLSQGSLLQGLSGLVLWGTVAYFSASKKWGYGYSKWGWFKQNQ